MFNRNFHIIFAIIFFIFSLSSNSAFGQIVLEKNSSVQKIGSLVSVLEDINRIYSIDDILSSDISKEFLQSSGDILSYGFSDSAYWVKLEIENPTNTAIEWVLEVSYPMLDSVQIFYNHNGRIKKQEAGDSLPFNNREKQYRNFLFTQSSPAMSKVNYFLRIESGSAINIPLKIWSPVALEQQISKEQFLLGLCFGSILIMILYNLLLFLALRVQTYLHYVLFMSTSSLFLFTLYGLSFKYLWPDFVWWANNCMPFLIFCCNATCVTFVRSFLETKREIQKLDKILKIYVSINLLFICASLLIEYAVSIKIATFLAVLAALLPLVVSLRLSIRLRSARFYLLAWSVLLFGIIVYGSKSFGLIPSFFLSDNSMLIGLLIEVLLLSLGIADRINKIKQERLDAHKSKLAAQRKAFEQQQKLTCSFERFVPKKFLNLLGKRSILDVELGDHVQKNMSVLFSDIRFFTSMSEKMTPKENFNFINSYLECMGPIIEKHNGVIDKYIGDAIMALFEEANDAINASISLLETLKEYNLGREQHGKPPISIGVGINSGDLMLGTIGAEGHMEGTVISDAVNLASRIEGLNKKYDASILISDNTRSELDNPDQYNMQIVDTVSVKGKLEPVTIWKVMP